VNSPLPEKLYRLLESGNRRIDFRKPAVRAALIALGLGTVAMLGTAAWIAYLDVRAVTPSLMEAREAYVRDVRAKIQDATDAARAGRVPPGLSGTLRARIIVNRQGRLVAATIMSSSGHPALDEFALRIVRESAPFERFPDKVRRTTRIVEIVSTFDFR